MENNEKKYKNAIEKYDAKVKELNEVFRKKLIAANRFVSDEKIKFMIFQNLGPRPVNDEYTSSIEKKTYH